MDGDNNKRNLQQIFVSTFHDKIEFDEFLRLDVTNEYKKISLKKRTVYAPTPKLKLIHRFLNHTVFEYADYNTDVVFSYRKGVSTRDAIEKHSHSNFFFQTDLSNFYANIYQSDVQNALTTQLKNTPVLDVENYVDKILELVVVDDHIPAGFSTSPLLSNICLFSFDNELSKYCQRNALIYTRYSDDLIISGDTNGFTNEIESVIIDLLEKYVNTKISINTAKTKQHKKGHKFKLLGFNILPNGLVTIPSEDKKEVESMLYFYLTDNDKFDSFFKKNMSEKEIELGEKSIRESALGSLSGKLIAFNSMDKNYITKLRRKYGNAVLDMFIRKSVK